MKTLFRKEGFPTSARQVFKTIDDLGVTGMHMTKSSMMMMGSKLSLEFLTPNKTGLGSRYRWTGRFFNKILCFFLADWYCRWCLKKMLGGAKKAITNHPLQTNHLFQNSAMEVAILSIITLTASQI